MINYLYSEKAKKRKIHLFSSYSQIYKLEKYKFLPRIFISILLVFIIILFLPWTQNISSRGHLIALNPAQRPQEIQTIISGQIQKWYVKEGDFVKTGDTILFITEVKDKFLDPNLLSRTKEQIDAKMQSAKSYVEKADALNKQSDAILKLRELKLVQTKNYITQTKLKLQADSIEFQAATVNFQIADKQLKRTQQLYEKGLKSLVDLEEKKQKYQETQAKKLANQNKWNSTKAQLINAYTDLAATENEYKEKFQKAQSDRFSTLSNLYDTDATVSKMSNEYASLKIRDGMYYIVAPQDGYVTKITSTGIGEILKENEKILTIMPAKYDLGIEMFVKPIDLPLIKKNNHVQLFFDGWPSIVFSGWPNASHGTFEGKVVAIDQYLSENGMFRIIVAPKTENYSWPEALRVGGGAQGFVMLGDVSVGFEIWRQLNAFPPNYYKLEKENQNLKEKK